MSIWRKWRNVYPKNIKEASASPVEHLGEEADQGQLEAGLSVGVHAVVRLHYQVPSEDKSFKVANTWYKCWGSVTFWCGYESGDPYLWLIDPDPDLTPDPDVTPDSTPFFSVFKDKKKSYYFLSYFFL